MCILEKPMLFCVFVFQEMGCKPLSGMVLISQISGRNKSQNFLLLIHKTCCYLVLFSILAPSVTVITLTVSLNLCVPTTPTQVHYVMFLREGWIVIECDLIPFMTITAIIIVMIMMIIPLVVAVLYYWMIFFLWMNMICCTFKHLWSSVFLRKTIQMETTLSVCYLHPVSHLQTLLTSAKDPAATLVSLTVDSRAWLENSNMTSMQTWLFSHDDFLCSPSGVRIMHTINICSLLVDFRLLSPQSVIVCSSNRIYSLYILTDVVDKSFSDS